MAFCSKCGTELAPGAAFCSGCGAPQSADVAQATEPAEPASPPKKTSGCLIAVLVVLGLGVIGAIVGGDNVGGRGESSAALRATSTQPAYAVTATELFNAYQANEAAAQEAYGDRLLDVTGTVAGVDLDLFDNPIVLLETPNQFMSAQAKLARDARGSASSFVQGQQVTLRCESLSEVIGTPMLRECRRR